MNLIHVTFNIQYILPYFWHHYKGLFQKVHHTLKLEALGEPRPPWPRQIITPIFPNVITLSLGGERLTPKVLDHYLHHDLGMLPLLWCFFAHLLILEYPDHHQNLISSSSYYPGSLHKIAFQSVHNFLSNVVHKQTNQHYQKHNLLCQGGNHNQ